MGPGDWPNPRIADRMHPSRVGLVDAHSRPERRNCWAPSAVRRLARFVSTRKGPTSPVVPARAGDARREARGCGGPGEAHSRRRLLTGGAPCASATPMPIDAEREHPTGSWTTAQVADLPTAYGSTFGIGRSNRASIAEVGSFPVSSIASRRARRFAFQEATSSPEQRSGNGSSH